MGPLSFSSPENAPPIPSHQAFMLLASVSQGPNSPALGYSPFLYNAVARRCSKGPDPGGVALPARLCATDSPRMLHSGLHHPLRPTSTPAPVSLPGILLRDGRADRVRREARGHVKGMLARAVRHSAGGGSCHVEPVADRSGAVEHRIGGGGGGAERVCGRVAGVDTSDGEEDCVWADCDRVRGCFYHSRGGSRSLHAHPPRGI